MMRRLVVLWFLFGLAACQMPVQHNTASGKVEATFENVPVNELEAAITNTVVNKGYRVTSSRSGFLSVEKPVDNPLAAAFFGSRYDSTPNARVNFSLIESGRTTRVVADFQIVTNPGSAFERITVANHNVDTLKWQAWLNELKSGYANYQTVPRGTPWIGVDIGRVTKLVATSTGSIDMQGAVIQRVAANGPGQTAGLKRGDIVLNFGQTPIRDHRVFAEQIRRAKAGNTVVLTVWRDRKEQKIPVTLGLKE